MKKVLITCQYATNKGDRAIAEYLIYQLKQMGDVAITLSTTQPALWQEICDENTRVIPMGYRDRSMTMKSGFCQKVIRRLTDKYYAKRIFPDMIGRESQHKRCERRSAKFIEEVRQADLVIITGGHHITSMRAKNGLFDVTYDIGLVSLYAKRYVLWSQTIGPLEFSDPCAKEFFGRVLAGAEAVYIRDANSRGCLQSLYPELTNVKKSFDSVFGFGILEHKPLENREKKVGISIFNGLAKAFLTFDAIAAILDSFAQKGYSIEFFRMEYAPKELQDIQDVIRRMKVPAKVEIFDFKSSTLEHLERMSNCSAYIGYKTHSVIMALTTATPLLGICYHKKTRDFMADYGLDAYAVDDETLTAENGIAVAEKLLKNATAVHETMRLHSRQLAQQIREDFCHMLQEGADHGSD